MPTVLGADFKSSHCGVSTEPVFFFHVIVTCPSLPDVVYSGALTAFPSYALSRDCVVMVTTLSAFITSTVTFLVTL